MSTGRRVACLVPFGLLLCAAGTVAYQCSRGPETGAETGKPSAADLPADKVFAAFREARKARDFEEFERWALEINRRRLLEGLSRDEIEGRLGKEHGTRWVYLDQKAMERRSFLTRWTLKKGDYWIYALCDAVTPVRLSFCLALDGDELAWTSYQRIVHGKPVMNVETYYAFVPTSQQAGSANKDEAEP